MQEVVSWSYDGWSVIVLSMIDGGFYFQGWSVVGALVSVWSVVECRRSVAGLWSVVLYYAQESEDDESSSVIRVPISMVRFFLHVPTYQEIVITCKRAFEAYDGECWSVR